jgi:hypothetical protein
VVSFTPWPAGVTVTYLRSYVTDSNHSTLNEVGQTMDVSLVRAHHRPGGALGHLPVVLLGNDSLEVWISMTNRDWRLSSHKGQWRFHDRSLPHSGIMTLGYHYGLPGINVGAFGLNTLKGLTNPSKRVGIRGKLSPLRGDIILRFRLATITW